MRLLVVDDEKQIRDGIGLGICWREYGVDEVVTAEDGISAWEHFCECPFEIVITDIRIPGIDGIELAGRILSQKPDTRIMIFTGYSEFEYAYKAMKLRISDFEVKPIHAPAVIAFVKKAVAELRIAAEESHGGQLFTEVFRAQILRNLFLDASVSPEQRECFQTYFGVEMRDRHFLALVQLSDTAEQIPAENFNDKRRFFDVLEQQFNELFARDTVIFIKISAESAVVLVYAKDGSGKRSVTVSATRALEGARQAAGCPAGVAVIGEENDAPLFEQYEEAKKLLQYVLYCGRERVLYDGDRLPGLQSGTQPFVGMARLKKAIELFDAQAARDVFSEELSQIAQARLLDNASVRNFCSDFLNALRVTAEGLIAGGKAQSDSEVLKLFQLPSFETIEEYRRAVLSRCDSVFALIENNRTHKYNPAVGKALRYIHQHYAEPLTTEAVAAHIRKSPNYFSQMFNTEVGESFPEYVMRLRIEEAKKLIDSYDSDYLVYEIAEKVGFSDYKYFSKIFRKFMGCSVSDYKTNKKL